MSEDIQAFVRCFKCGTIVAEPNATLSSGNGSLPIHITHTCIWRVSEVEAP